MARQFSTKCKFGGNEVNVNRIIKYKKSSLGKRRNDNQTPNTYTINIKPEHTIDFCMLTTALMYTVYSRTYIEFFVLCCLFVLKNKLIAKGILK